MCYRSELALSLSLLVGVPSRLQVSTPAPAFDLKQCRVLLYRKANTTHSKSPNHICLSYPLGQLARHPTGRPRYLLYGTALENWLFAREHS